MTPTNLKCFLHLAGSWLFALSCLVGVSPLAAAADPASFAGEWISRSIEGAGSPNNDPGCAAISWTDRKIKLEQIAGNPRRFRGEWVRKFQSLWMGVHGETCRFPGETQFVDTHLGVQGWTLSGVYDPKSDTVHLTGDYNNCDGNFCPQMQATAKGFTTDLRIAGQDLIDADPTQSSDDQRHFISNTSDSNYNDEITQALHTMLGFVDKGDFDALYQHSGAVTHQTISLDKFRTDSRALRARTGPVLSRSPMYTMFANYSPLSKRPAQNAFIMNVVYFSGNVRTIEYILMAKESGDWKMTYYYLGGGNGSAGPSPR